MHRHVCRSAAPRPPAQLRVGTNRSRGEQQQQWWSLKWLDAGAFSKCARCVHTAGLVDHPTAGQASGAQPALCWYEAKESRKR